MLSSIVTDALGLLLLGWVGVALLVSYVLNRSKEVSDVGR